MAELVAGDITLVSIVVFWFVPPIWKDAAWHVVGWALSVTMLALPLTPSMRPVGPGYFIVFGLVAVYASFRGVRALVGALLLFHKQAGEGRPNK